MTTIPGLIYNTQQVIYCRLSTEALVIGERGYCKNTPLVENVISFSHFLLAVNSSANFIIYTWRGAREDQSQSNLIGENYNISHSRQLC